MSKEGYACLTRGLGSSVIRAFPVNAATFYVYTFVMKYFGDMDSIKQEMSAMKDSIKVNNTFLHFVLYSLLFFCLYC